MKYFFYLEHQLKLYGLFIVTASSTYGIMYYFGWRKTIPLDENHIIGFISYSLTYIFFGAYINRRMKILDK